MYCRGCYSPYNIRWHTTKDKRIMHLVRTHDSSAGMFGVLIVDERPLCVTLENPWLDNQVGISCVPPGTYHCERIDSPNFGDTFMLEHVPDRSHILFHHGNTEPDTRGCILLGQYYGLLGRTPAVLNSRATRRLFMDKLVETNSFTLEISQPPYM